MSMQWMQSVISIKDKQTIISHVEKSEKGTNLALKFKISKQQISDNICKNKEKMRDKTYIHTYIHTLLARPHGAFQSQFYITKL